MAADFSPLTAHDVATILLAGRDPPALPADKTLLGLGLVVWLLVALDHAGCAGGGKPRLGDLRRIHYDRDLLQWHCDERHIETVRPNPFK